MCRSTRRQLLVLMESGCLACAILVVVADRMPDQRAGCALTGVIVMSLSIWSLLLFKQLLGVERALEQ